MVMNRECTILRRHSLIEKLWKAFEKCSNFVYKSKTLKLSERCDRAPSCLKKIFPVLSTAA
jgi:hypothetical protein